MWILCRVIQTNGHCRWVLRHARSQMSCLRSLRAKQLEAVEMIPISVRFVKKQTQRMIGWNAWIDLWTQLHAQLSNGFSLLHAFQRIHCPKHAQLQMFVEQATHNIKQGHPFSQALQDRSHTLPDICVQLIQYGEREHYLLIGIEKTIAMLQVYQDMQARLQRALFYPMTIFVSLCVFFCIVLFFVMPQLQSLANSDAGSMWLSWVQNHPFVGCGGVVVFCIVSIWWIQKHAWGLFMRFAQWFHGNDNRDWHLFATVLHAHLNNGQTLKTGFQKAQAFLPRNLNDRQWSHQGFIKQLPMPFQEIFDKPLLEVMAKLQQLAQFYWDAYRQRLSQRLKWVEPACLLAMAVALIVGLILVFYPLVSAMHTLEFF